MQQDPIESILDLARWAPSGDNTQPWRFQRLGPRLVRVHAFDTRDHCVYDLDGHPSQISMGTLLETASIAASAQGMQMQVTRADWSDIQHPRFDLEFDATPGLAPSPLLSAIRERSVQRRPLERRPLNDTQREQLSSCLPADHQLLWIEGPHARWRTAQLLFRSARLRLTIPEAYEVHRDIIEWGCRYSATKVPDQALGASALTLGMMRPAMQSWSRVNFLNRFLAGTWAPRIELDLLPALRCAGHFVILAKSPPEQPEHYVQAGRAIQRFWLSATLMGLQLQPEVTPLVFSRYARAGRKFSTAPHASPLAENIDSRLKALIGADAALHAVFMGRLGFGAAAQSRSTRRELAELMLPPDAD